MSFNSSQVRYNNSIFAVLEIYYGSFSLFLQPFSQKSRSTVFSKMAVFLDFTPFLKIGIFCLEIDRLFAFGFLEYLEHSKSLGILGAKTGLVEKVLFNGD